jgi:hypothetical protein
MGAILKLDSNQSGQTQILYGANFAAIMCYEAAGIITSDAFLKMRKKLLFHWGVPCLGFKLLPLPINGNGGDYKTEAFMYIERRMPAPSASLPSQPSTTPSISSSPSMSQSLLSVPSSSSALPKTFSWVDIIYL